MGNGMRWPSFLAYEFGDRVIINFVYSDYHGIVGYIVGFEVSTNGIMYDVQWQTTDCDIVTKTFNAKQIERCK